MIIIEIDDRNMKRCDMKRIILILVFLLAMIIPGNVLAASNVEVNIDPDSPFEEGAFYGIWMGASKELEDAVVYASDYPAEIGAVQIFLTTDWENLNPEPWYVLTAGMYASRTEAESVLPMIQAYYPDAYVKYSGKRLSHFANDTSKTSGWLGTWIADDGEKLVITDTSDVTLSMIYYGYYAKGGMFESPYILFFQNSEKTIAAEAQEVLDIEGWRRELELSGDVIVMHSRYPDKLFYRVTEPTLTPTETPVPEFSPEQVVDEFYNALFMTTDFDTVYNYTRPPKFIDDIRKGAMSEFDDPDPDFDLYAYEKAEYDDIISDIVNQTPWYKILAIEEIEKARTGEVCRLINGDRQEGDDYYEEIGTRADFDDVADPGTEVYAVVVQWGFGEGDDAYDETDHFFLCCVDGKWYIIGNYW